MVERIHRSTESADARLHRLALAAEREDEELRYRILGMIFDAHARQWVSDLREGIYVSFRSEAEAAAFQELLERFVSVVERHSIRVVERVLVAVDDPSKRAKAWGNTD